PELDFHAGPSGVTLAQVRERYDIPFDDYGICVFHPVTSEADTMGTQADALFGALDQSDRNFVVIAPNNDPGSAAIFDAIACLPKERFRVLPSMRFAHFSELMKNAKAMIGNSSAGVREAPFLGLPSLDIGTRQTNRAKSPSVFFADATDTAAINTFLQDRWGQAYPRHDAFGGGSASERFVDALRSEDFWQTSLQKTFHDIPN
ncbi:UDP-N-acetylglucosamine 2-epimerase, partial [Yoonia sp.]|uniref:UDP-N-acetylglucosamine 2-epimerase n=1 Tax=Yoonia sp. TaxID=2212373 RepID=UPI002DF99838|nr:UDP-N-acetylglucosamine 2-epimerase [Yoonia sp.]